MDAQERTAFLLWRRALAAVEEAERLVLTPFEKNLEVWRQLWRVVERSHIVVQVGMAPVLGAQTSTVQGPPLHSGSTCQMSAIMLSVGVCLSQHMCGPPTLLSRWVCPPF